MTHQPPVAVQLILREVADERRRQDERWGRQDWPNGNGGAAHLEMAEDARAETQRAYEDGTLTWVQILRKEVLRAFAEPVSGPFLRGRLVRVAAIAVAWIQAIDRASL